MEALIDLYTGFEHLQPDSSYIDHCTEAWKSSGLSLLNTSAKPMYIVFDTDTMRIQAQWVYYYDDYRDGKRILEKYKQLYPQINWRYYFVGAI